MYSGFTVTRFPVTRCHRVYARSTTVRSRVLPTTVACEMSSVFHAVVGYCHPRYAGPKALDPTRHEEAPAGELQVVGGYGDEGKIGLALQGTARGVRVREEGGRQARHRGGRRAHEEERASECFVYVWVRVVGWGRVRLVIIKIKRKSCV